MNVSYDGEFCYSSKGGPACWSEIMKQERLFACLHKPKIPVGPVIFHGTDSKIISTQSLFDSKR